MLGEELYLIWFTMGHVLSSIDAEPAYKRRRMFNRPLFFCTGSGRIIGNFPSSMDSRLSSLIIIVSTGSLMLRSKLS